MIYLVLILYILLPFISTPFLVMGAYIDRRNVKVYLFLFILNLSILGYYFVPEVTKDLYSHFNSMQLLVTQFSFGGFKIIFQDPLIIKNLWFLLIGLSGNSSLLPLTAILSTYVIITFKLVDFIKKEDISHKLAVPIIMLTMLFIPLIWPMSGVRYTTAMAILFWATYRDFIENKTDKINIILYIVACMIHYSIAPLVALIYLVKILKKNTRIVLILLLASGSLIDIIIIPIFNIINLSYITGIQQKIMLYDTYNNVGVYYKFTVLLKVAFSLAYILMYLYMKFSKNPGLFKYKKLYDFGLVLSIFLIGMYNYDIVIDRFGYVVIINFSILMLNFFKYAKNKIVFQFYYLLYPGLATLALYLNYVPFKTTEYSISFLELFSQNIIKLLIK